MKKSKFVVLIVFFVFAFLTLNINKSYPEPRNVLIEYITGTWCGNCPCGHQTLNTISSMYPQTIIVAYHAFSNDPWRIFNGNEIVNLLGFNATPTAGIDRGNTVSLNDYFQWIIGVQNRYTASPNTNVNLVIGSKSYNEVSRELSVALNATALVNLAGQYKVSFVIVENNLVYPQNQYVQCGTPGYIQNYVHSHVARNMVNGAAGENLNSNGEWNQNETLVKNVSTVIDAGWVDGNCKLIAFVYRDSSVLASANVEQTIEEEVLGSVGISGNYGEVPNEYILSQNYPNPFNPSTNIKFVLPKDGIASFKIYDIFGKEVENYVNGFLQKGTYNVEFDGTNLPSGIYFYVLKTDNYFEKKKMILLK